MADYYIPANNTDYDFARSLESHDDYQSFYKKLKDNGSLWLTKEQYDNVLGFKKRRDYSECRDEDKCVYQLQYCSNGSGNQFLKTYNYIGFIPIGKKDRIIIDTGKHRAGEKDLFLLRLLKYVSGDVYFDSSEDDSIIDTPNDASYSLLIMGYLFLFQFRKAFAKGIPLQYVKHQEHGLNIKGQINIKEYIQRDMLYGYKLTYSYSQLEYIQDIIDVLYITMREMDDSAVFTELLNSGDYARFYRQLRQLYSGKRPSASVINRIEQQKALKNPMYSDYKETLRLARFILEHRNVIHDDDSDRPGNPGFLVDVSELWELYVAELIRRSDYFRENNYRILEQQEAEYTLYNDTFIKKKNIPDIVLENEDNVLVIDAKFKTMKFRPFDVDRDDLHQIHSYSGFFNLKSKKEGKTLKVSSLVYPYYNDESDSDINEIIESRLYSNDAFEDTEVKTVFSIGYVRISDQSDPAKFDEEMTQYEQEYIERLQKSISMLDNL
ncbi:MAG: hypothetical protein IJ757_06165 [Clostridiales bacterium]|nr:hypothetical protein [Clostridiales bacterium]